MKRRLCMTLVTASLLSFGCRPTNTPSSSSSEVSTHRSGIIDTWLKDKSVYQNIPVVTPSVVFQRLGQGEGGADRQRALLGKILAKVIDELDNPAAKAILDATFGPAIASGLDALSQLEPGTPGYDAAFGPLVEKTRLYFVANPQKMDRFPTVPLASIEKVQQALFQQGHETNGDLHPRPFSKADDNAWHQTVLRSDGCTPAQSSARVIDKSIGLVDGAVPLVPANSVGCFADNSARLAELINRLSNSLAGESPKATLTIEGAASTVTDHASLLKALSDAGFSIEMYNMRGFVNFLSYSIKGANGPEALRVATWFSMPVDGQTKVYPGEHGEIDLLLKRGTQVWANLRWFVGIPAKGYKGVVAYWRPYDFLRQPWEAVVRESLEIRKPAELSHVTAWLDAAAWTAMGVQAVWDRYKTPISGYGIYVCSDSLSLVLQKLRELRRGTTDESLNQPYPSGRSTAAFPLIRARTAHVEGDVDALFAKYAKMDASSLGQLIPPDSELYKNQPNMKTRINETFPDNEATRTRMKLLQAN